jgi:hypothetical protein
VLARGVRGQAGQRLAGPLLEGARRGEHGPGMEFVRKLAGDKGLPRALLVTLARIAACSSAAAAKDAKLTADERQKLAERYADRAVELLTQAQAAGHFADAADREGLKAEADFAALREHAGFREFLRKVETGK